MPDALALALTARTCAPYARDARRADPVAPRRLARADGRAERARATHPRAPSRPAVRRAARAASRGRPLLRPPRVRPGRRRPRHARRVLRPGRARGPAPARPPRRPGARL